MVAEKLNTHTHTYSLTKQLPWSGVHVIIWNASMFKYNYTLTQTVHSSLKSVAWVQTEFESLSYRKVHELQSLIIMYLIKITIEYHMQNLYPVCTVIKLQYCTTVHYCKNFYIYALGRRNPEAYSCRLVCVCVCVCRKLSQLVQFSFLSNRSTSSALVSVTHHSLSILDSVGSLYGVLLDVIKAFNTVSRRLLLHV